MILFFRQFFIFVVALFGFSIALAQTSDSLPAKRAFAAKIIRADEKSLTVRIEIASGYYLYRNRLFSLTSQTDDLVISDVVKSAGIDKNDPFFGTQSIWYGGKNAAEIEVFYNKPSTLQQANLLLKYQGCHDGVLCYPPQKISLPVDYSLDYSAAVNDSQNNQKSSHLGSQTKIRQLFLSPYTFQFVAGGYQVR